MARFRQLTPRKKGVAVALRKEGLSTTKIASKLGCSHSTVVRLLIKNRQTGMVDRRKGSGRKFASSTRQDRVLKRLCIGDRRATSTVLKRGWEEKTGVKVSGRTVRRRLFKMGFLAVRPLKKPLLTAKMRAARLAWAKKYVAEPLTFWQSVIFSDESKINLTGPDSCQYVRRRPREQFLPECLTSTVKFPVSQMIWGCISSRGVGRRHFVTTTVKAPDYVGILEKKLIPTVRDHFGSAERCIFQDDSAPCHRARLTEIWIKENKIQRLSWPGNSPDLNPIEHCWSLLKKKVSQRKPSSKQSLQEAIVQSWNHDLGIEYIRKLIDSMPDRLRAVVKARGGATRY